MAWGTRPLDVLERLMMSANRDLEGLGLRWQYRIPRDWLPGELVSSASEEDRALLRKLTSEDIREWNPELYFWFWKTLCRDRKDLTAFGWAEGMPDKVKAWMHKIDDRIIGRGY